MLLSADASVRWYIIILILIAGIFGVVFCLLLLPSVLLIIPFHMLCQCSLSLNSPFCQWFLPLIDFYIDIWDYGIVFCLLLRPSVLIYAPRPLLIRLYLLSAPPINVSVLFPVDTSPFLSMITSANYFVCIWKEILIAVIVGIVIASIFGILFCLLLQPYVLLVRPFCLSFQCVPLAAFLMMFPSLRFYFRWYIDQLINKSIGEYWCLGF